MWGGSGGVVVVVVDTLSHSLVKIRDCLDWPKKKSPILISLFSEIVLRRLYRGRTICRASYTRAAGKLGNSLLLAITTKHGLTNLCLLGRARICTSINHAARVSYTSVRCTPNTFPIPTAWASFYGRCCNRKKTKSMLFPIL